MRLFAKVVECENGIAEHVHDQSWSERIHAVTIFAENPALKHLECKEMASC